jgi:hypothetical protein
MKYAFLPVELWGYYEDYDRIVYLAPNVLPTTNVDLELMFSTTGDKPVAAVTGIESHLTIFDSSLMVLSPDKEVYEELLRSVADIGNTYGTMMSFIKDTVDSSVLNILAIPEESDVYTGLLTMVFLNRAFPDWHDLDGTGRHHSTGATLLSSHAAELRVDSWMRNQPSSFKEDAAIVSLVDSTQFVQFQGYAPWSCSSRCAAKGWHCGFNKNGVFKDSVQEYLYRGTKPMFSKIFWLTLADASTESQQWCSNRVDTVLCYVMESDEYMQPYRPAQ